MSEKKYFPPVISFKKLIGPSFIILALGLGSGEVILWPYMVSNYGLGIVWGALLGLTFQYFINMEISRYALVKGESVFVGINKFWKGAAYWFIFSTFIGFGLPGIVAASAQLFASVFAIANFKWLAISFLIIIGLILSLGKTVYGMMEKITKTVILLGVPFVFILAIILSSKMDWQMLLQGFVGRGEGYSFLPLGISLTTFLAAFAYSGAGGNLNLTQSIYIKEKGYGMGVYSQKIAGLFAHKGEKNEVKLAGEEFEINHENVSRFKAWWKKISLEHLLVFWLVGLLSMIFLMILSYSTVYGLESNKEGISFVINQGLVIGQNVFPWVGSLFLLVLAIMLFQTQLGVMDSTSRIMAENWAIKKIEKNKNNKINLSKIYFTFLWSQIIFGILLFLFNFYEPKKLIILGAVINAIAMFVHIALVFFLNHRELPKMFRPSWWRKIVLALIFIFFGFFSGFVLISNFFG
ncbi:MAG: Nramp family divalent metal transporter [Candidatus Magasanikbacteria bacterium]